MVIRRRRGGERGFTMIELLVSLLISMVGLLGLLGLQLLGVRANAASRSFVEATALAQDRLERLQSVPYTSLPTYAATETSLASLPTSGAQASGLPSSAAIYTRTTAVDTTTTAGITFLTVSVSWTDPYSTTALTHSVTLREARSP